MTRLWHWACQRPCHRRNWPFSAYSAALVRPAPGLTIAFAFNTYLCVPISQLPFFVSCAFPVLRTESLTEAFLDALATAARQSSEENAVYHAAQIAALFYQGQLLVSRVFDQCQPHGIGVLPLSYFFFQSSLRRGSRWRCHSRSVEVQSSRMDNFVCPRTSGAGLEQRKCRSSRIGCTRYEPGILGCDRNQQMIGVPLNSSNASFSCICPHLSQNPPQRSQCGPKYTLEYPG